MRLEVRTAGGRAALLPEKAAELVRLKVDVIVASLTPSVKAAKDATSDIPIVMAPAGDPLETGLVASLARPGGNVTGVSTAAAEVAGKTIELIHEVFPSATRVAVLANATDSFTRPYLAQIEEGGRRTGLAIETFMERPDAPLEPAFEAMRAKQPDALIVQGTMSRKRCRRARDQVPACLVRKPADVANGRRAHVVFRQLCGDVCAGGGLCRQDPQGPQAR